MDPNQQGWWPTKGQHPAPPPGPSGAGWSAPSAPPPPSYDEACGGPFLPAATYGAPVPATSGGGGQGLPYPVQGQGPAQYFPNVGPAQQPVGYPQYPAAAPGMGPGWTPSSAYKTSSAAAPPAASGGAAVGVFDAGARFGPYSPQVIPPPPPGVAPNAAQLAMMSGATPVVMKQKKGGFFNGTGSGGYTFW